MTITRERIADLCPGDVVELRDDRWPEGTVTRGPLRKTDHGLCVAALMVVDSLGDLFDAGGHRSLTVISRAPRPLYVNHDRTEPVPGDVAVGVDDHDGCPVGCAFYFRSARGWVDRHGRSGSGGNRLRLLVDGETGRVVR